jgi:hypothetical protein
MGFGGIYMILLDTAKFDGPSGGKPLSRRAQSGSEVSEITIAITYAPCTVFEGMSEQALSTAARS